MLAGSCTLSRSVAVAGPTPVSVVSCVRAEVGKSRDEGEADLLMVVLALGVFVSFRAFGAFGFFGSFGSCGAKPAEVADLMTEGSFLRIWAGRKGRFVPWVLCMCLA
jgi:hypothetical protein